MARIMRLLVWLCLVWPSLGFLAPICTQPLFPMALFATKTILAPPLLSTEGKEGAVPALEVVYTTDTSTMEAWLEKHATPHDNTATILGFDSESIPRASFLSYGRRPANEREGPATLQLATLDSCLLVHLAHWPQTHLEALQCVLQDKSVLKAGVAIDEDALEVYRSSFGFEVTSRLDLSCALAGAKPGRRLGLRDLLAGASKVDLPKSKKISMSNWGAKTLTNQQLVYAARDAWAAAKVVQSLQGHGKGSLVPIFLEREERAMADMDVRSRKRKKARIAFKQLKEQVAPLTNEQKKEQDKLWRIMDDMRPDQPINFNITMDE